MRPRAPTSGFLRAVRCRPIPDALVAAYAFVLPAVRAVEELALHPAVNFFVGENGSGKSTVLEAIAVAAGFNAEGGSRNFRFSTRQTVSQLSDHIYLERNVPRESTGYFLRAESFYNLATEIDRLDEEGGPGRPVRDSYGGQSLHEQSHGESFWALFMHRLTPKGLYLFDEPEAALSPSRQLAFLVRLHELVNEGCQFIIVTHAPILLAYPNAQLWRFDETGITPTTLEETDHFQITKRMLNDTGGMLRRLLSDDP